MEPVIGTCEKCKKSCEVYKIIIVNDIRLTYCKKCAPIKGAPYSAIKMTKKP